MAKNIMVKIKTKFANILLLFLLFIGLIYLYCNTTLFELFTTRPSKQSFQINIDNANTYFIFNTTTRNITQIQVSGNITGQNQYIANIPLSIYYTSPLLNQSSLADTCTTDSCGNFICNFDYNLPKHHFSSQQSAIPMQITGTLINPYPNTAIPITTPRPTFMPNLQPIQAKPAPALPLINSQYGKNIISANFNVYMKKQ